MNTCALKDMNDDKLIQNRSFPSMNDNNIFNNHEISFSPDISYDKNHDLRPHLFVKIKDNFHCVLLDTGASISIFGKNSFNLWNEFSTNSSRKVNVMIANGKLLDGSNVKKIPIYYNNEVKFIDFTYVKEVTTPIVLGINFFHEFNFKIIQNPCVNDVDNYHSLQLISTEEKYELDVYQKIKLKEIMSQFLFDDNDALGCQKLIEHKIDTGDHMPIVQHQYSYNPIVMEKIHVVVDNWLSQGVIEKSYSAWRNPMVAVTKPNKSIRLCLDARKLNFITKKDCLLTPSIFDSLTSIPHDVTIFARLDKNQAFLQTMLRLEDREKTAFFIKGRGLFHFIRMPFGLSNAPATQTRLMLELFGDLSPYVLVYFDDIIAMGRDVAHLMELLKIIGKRLSKNNITISREKMNVGLKKIKILGHFVDSNGIHIDSGKLNYIRDYPKPEDKKELQRFLGICNWYRRHIPDFSLISSPLTDLTRGKIFAWNDKAQESFSKLKNILTSPAVLKKPRWDLPMILQCDASDIGIGAVLTQIDENKLEYVIEYFSCKLSDREKKYSPTEKECLAVIKSIIHFRSYIELNVLRIITDHYSLKYLLNMKVTSGRLARWILFLQPYVTCIEHRAGSLMTVPDALSRAPILNSNDDDFSNALLMSMTITDDWYNELLLKIMQNPIKYSNLRIINNKIFTKTSFKRNILNDDWREIPHPSILVDIIKEAHEYTLHGGIKSTLFEIQNKYVWTNMRNDINNFIKSCIKCACVKPPNYKLCGPMIDSIIPQKCKEIYSIDVKGPLPPSGTQRYRFILVIMDVLSRFAWVKLFNTVKSFHIINFLEKVCSTYGYPKSLIHDNASQFTSSDFNKYLDLHNINSHHIPVYTPKNNPVERLNRSISEGLIFFLTDNGKNHSYWSNYVEEIINSLNYRRNEATHLPPVEVFFGFIPNDPKELVIPHNDDKHKQIMKYAYENSINKFNWNKNYYNKDKFVRKFSPGDIVMVKKHNLSNAFNKFNAKLEAKWIPTVILEKTFNNGYRVRNNDNRVFICDLTEIKNISLNLQSLLRENNNNLKID